MKPAILLLLIGLTGCTHGGSGVKWWNPSTWSSGNAVRETAKAEVLVDGKREATLKAAQRAAHESLFAWLLTGAGRVADTGREAAQTATGLLDQALGALPVDELTELRVRVDGLTSENEAIRKRAEKDRQEARQNAAAIALELEKARDRLKTAQSELMAAFQRENALANELRNDRLKSLFWKIGLGSGILIFGGLYIYVRYVAGGIPGALGKMLASAQTRNPTLAATMRSELDPYLNRAEQAQIKKQLVKEANKLETA